MISNSFAIAKVTGIIRITVVTLSKKADATAVKLTEKDVLERINAQFDYDTYKHNGEFIVNNDGNIEQLKEQIVTAISSVINA